jgi:hypothetical protein
VVTDVTPLTYPNDNGDDDDDDDDHDDCNNTNNNNDNTNCFVLVTGVTSKTLSRVRNF